MGSLGQQPVPIAKEAHQFSLQMYRSSVFPIRADQVIVHRVGAANFGSHSGTCHERLRIRSVVWLLCYAASFLLLRRIAHLSHRMAFLLS